jgi:predicted permease
LGIIAMRALLVVNTANLPRIGEEGDLVTIDWRVLAFTALVTLTTSLIFGLVPALRASRPDLIVALKESASRGGSGMGQHYARTILVVTEIALAVVLLIGAALLIRTSLALSAVKPGYDTNHVLTMRMSLTGPRFATSAGIEQVVREGVERIRAIPGVEIVSASCCVPLEGGYGLPFLVVGRPLNDRPFHGGGGWLTVSPGYFESFKIPIIRGRSFDDRDAANGPPVVLINEAMAKQFWPKADPLRDTIWIGKGIMSELALERPRQVIGIVGNVRDGGLNREPGPTMYVPNAQVPDALNALNTRLTPLKWIVRTHGDPLALAAPIQEQIRQSTGLPVADIRTMDDVLLRSTSRQRFNMLLMTIFGGAALLLASIGVYGLMSHSVQQRTQEIGIRMALGAQISDVRRMVIGQGMRFALAGVAVGVLGAYFLAKLITTFLYGVEPWDPLVFITVPVTLTAIALFAVWLPSRRATSIDPVIALRYE